MQYVYSSKSALYKSIIRLKIDGSIIKCSGIVLIVLNNTTAASDLWSHPGFQGVKIENNHQVHFRWETEREDSNIPLIGEPTILLLGPGKLPQIQGGEGGVREDYCNWRPG